MGLMTLCCWGTWFLMGCSIRLNPGGTEEPFCGLDIVVFCRLCEMLLSDWKFKNKLNFISIFKNVCFYNGKFIEEQQVFFLHFILTGLDGSSLTQDAGGTGAELGSGAMARPANFCPALTKSTVNSESFTSSSSNNSIKIRSIMVQKDKKPPENQIWNCVEKTI